MAALLIPAPFHSHPHRPAPRRPQLAVVPVAAYSPAGARRRAMAPVYRRRRIGVALMLATFIILGDHAASAVVRAVSASAVAPSTATSVATPTGAAGTTDLPAGAVAPAVVPVASHTVVVQPGDSLWSIARVLQPGGDVRSLVDELARRAGGSGIQAGQRIDVSGLGTVDPVGRS